MEINWYIWKNKMICGLEIRSQRKGRGRAGRDVIPNFFQPGAARIFFRSLCQGQLMSGLSPNTFVSKLPPSLPSLRKFHKQNVVGWTLPSANLIVCELENGPVEIVDLPSYNMVLFHSFCMFTRGYYPTPPRNVIYVEKNEWKTAVSPQIWVKRCQRVFSPTEPPTNRNRSIVDYLSSTCIPPCPPFLILVNPNRALIVGRWIIFPNHRWRMEF